jgi:hypothetical protein
VPIPVAGDPIVTWLWGGLCHHLGGLGRTDLRPLLCEVLDLPELRLCGLMIGVVVERLAKVALGQVEVVQVNVGLQEITVNE